MSQIEANPKLMRYLEDPAFASVLEEMQRDPAAVKRKYQVRVGWMESTGIVWLIPEDTLMLFIVLLTSHLTFDDTTSLEHPFFLVFVLLGEGGSSLLHTTMA